MIVAFSGHRPGKLGGYHATTIRSKLMVRLGEILLTLKPAKTISGMAQGFDQDAFELCVGMRIPVVAAVPFRGQELRWPKAAQHHYHALLMMAANVAILSEENGRGMSVIRAIELFNKRNEWMVDHSDVLVVAWSGVPGGTTNCVRYAEKVKRKTIVIDPREFLSHEQSE